MTTPSPPLRRLRAFLLLAQPPLLFQEGNTLSWQFIHTFMKRRDSNSQTLDSIKLSADKLRRNGYSIREGEKVRVKIVSVNVGLPREFEFNNNTFMTGIFKAPAIGRVRVRTMNLEGDRQADLSVHGGVDKAVYAYPSEHYGFWKDAYPWLEMPWGMLGENITTEGMDEHVINIGDQFRFGSSILMVKQPRMPCQKLAAKFGGADVGKRMIAGRRNGFYLSVVQEGEVAAGDSIELVHRSENSIKVSDVVLLHTAEKANRALLHRAIETDALPESWRAHFAKKLAALGKA